MKASDFTMLKQSRGSD